MTAHQDHAAWIAKNILATKDIRCDYEEFGFSSVLYDQFVYEFDPKFHVEMSEPYAYGDHPDTGGGVQRQDVEGVTLIEAGGRGRDWWVGKFGKAFVEQIEEEHGDRQ